MKPAAGASDGVGSGVGVALADAPGCGTGVARNGKATNALVPAMDCT